MILYFISYHVRHKMQLDQPTHSWVSTYIHILTWKITDHENVSRGIISELVFLLCGFSLTVTC